MQFFLYVSNTLRWGIYRRKKKIGKMSTNKLNLASLAQFEHSRALARHPHRDVSVRMHSGSSEIRVSLAGHSHPIVVVLLPAVIYSAPNHHSKICRVCKHTSTALSQPYLYCEITCFHASRTSRSSRNLQNYACMCLVRAEHGGSESWFVCTNEGYMYLTKWPTMGARQGSP